MVQGRYNLRLPARSLFTLFQYRVNPAGILVVLTSFFLRTVMSFRLYLLLDAEIKKILSKPKFLEILLTLPCTVSNFDRPKSEKSEAFLTLSFIRFGTASLVSTSLAIALVTLAAFLATGTIVLLRKRTPLRVAFGNVELKNFVTFCLHLLIIREKLML